MEKTQRCDDACGFTPMVIFLKKVLPVLCFLVFSTQYLAAQAIPAKPDSLPAPKQDSTKTLPPKSDSIPKKSVQDTLSKPVQKTDSATSSRQNFDPLVKPAAKIDTAGKSGAGADSLPKSVGKADTLKNPVKQSDSLSIPGEIKDLGFERAGVNTASDSLAGPGARPVKGRVTDEGGEGLPGVSVLVKNTKIQAVTSPDGLFDIKVPGEKSILVFSYMGFTTQERLVKRQTSFNISLNPEAKALKEVVVVGYGTQSKRDLASSTSRVAAQEIKSAVVNTLDQALQGRATGVQVTQSSGEPGASTVVRIRGNNSLSGNNEPLYVIDGFPMPPYREASANFTGAYAQNGLYGINPNDIESMEVLKDASATAIYGSRGANGVVLITTKAGKRGAGRVELVNKTSFGSISRPIKMMNGRQYAEVINESYRITDRPEPFKNLDSSFTNTNWIDAITQPSFRQDVTLSVSGGSPKSSYYVSGNYLTEKGTIINSDNNRASLRVNLNNEVTNWYTLKGQLSLVRQKSNRAITTGHAWPNSGGLMDGLRASPLLDLNYLGNNALGVPGFVGTYFANPYNELKSKTDISKNDYIIANVENWFKIVNGLQLVVSLGTNQNLTRRNVFMPPTTAEGRVVNGSGSNSLSNTYSYNVNAYFLYEQTLNKDHYLNTTLGVEYNDQTVEFLNTVSSGYDVPFFGIDNIGSAHNQSISSYKEGRRLQSGFFRANYSFKGRYVLNTSLRLDGASPFAANKKYGLFPAVALAWNLDQEPFMKNVKAISNTKLRASFGETGSQAIGPYSSLAQFWPGFYEMGNEGTIATSLYPTSIGNPNLSWERTRQFNAGFDFNTANDRLVVSFDYYNKTTMDLLQYRVVPSQSGVTSIIDNYGTMRNRGVELTLQANLIKKKNISFSTRFNISRNINTLVDLGDKKTPDYVQINGNLLGGVSGILTPGEEVGRFFGYKVVGLAQKSDFDAEGVPQYPISSLSTEIPGTWKYDDKNGNGWIDAEDRQILGKSSPDFTFGWTNDFTWKGFALNAFFTGSVGNDVLNLTRFYLNNGIVNYSGIAFNQSEDWYKKRWTESNQHNDPLYPSTQRGLSSPDINSTMIEDGSFIRLKTLTLSYTFPKLGVIQNPRLFVTGTNIATFTKYKGFDPEVSSFNQSLLQQGIDYGAYPAQRSYTIGFSCNF